MFLNFQETLHFVPNLGKKKTQNDYCYRKPNLSFVVLIMDYYSCLKATIINLFNYMPKKE